LNFYFISPSEFNVVDFLVEGFYPVLFVIRMMEVVVVTTGAISRAKLQSNHHQQTNTQL